MSTETKHTPLTDAAAVGIIGFFSCATVTADFARRLELERNVLLAACRSASSKLRDVAVNNSACSAELHDIAETLYNVTM